MPDVRVIEALKQTLEKIPDVVYVDKIQVKDNIIQYIVIKSERVGTITVEQLEEKSAKALYNFYFFGLAERSRRLFVPYPLFNPPPTSSDDLAQRIADWKKEDDWSALKMVKSEEIIGFGLLKRFRSEKVTSGIAIRDNFVKMNLGYLLQTIINEQARLLSIKSFHVKVVSDNIASVRLHEKCGFRTTRVIHDHNYHDMLQYLKECDKAAGGEKIIERQIIEMVIKLNNE